MLAAPLHWPTACAALTQADPTLGALIAQHPTGQLTSRGEPFTTLVRSIVGQQISVLAADAVWARLTALTPLQPELLLALPPEALRSVGLSGQKIRYIHGLAHGFHHGTVHPHRWPEMPDDAIIAELTQLPGIGRWTAEMFLMFNLLRPDVLPLDDIGLLKGALKLYPQAPLPGPQKGTAKYRPLQHWLQQHAERWRPHRSVATWFLWRSLDPTDVAY
jgi:DNA-3-methyladenine glycosylase II